MLEAVRLERDRKAPAPIELVWTGPEATTSTVRDTIMVMKDTLARARSDVLIAGYTFDHGSEILEPLAEVMRTHGVKTTIVLNIDASGAIQADKRIKHAVASFLNENWPKGTPTPRLYHDPRKQQSTPRCQHAPPRLSLADSRHCLVGSGQLHAARPGAQHRDGPCWVDSPPLAQQILGHWQALIQGAYIQLAHSPDD